MGQIKTIINFVLLAVTVNRILVLASGNAMRRRPP
jgi:hypothetical protein